MKKVFSLLSAFLTFLMTVTVGVKTPAVKGSAQETNLPSIESSNVLDDLDGATIENKEFSLSDYPVNLFGDVELITFLEYGYDGAENADYGLYTYVYNPAKVAFDTSSPLNMVQLQVGESTNYSKYSLSFVNSAENGVLQKYKVTLTDEEKTSILTAFSDEERVYRVSGVELLTNGNVNADEYKVGKEYAFCGVSETLTCNVVEFDTLSLDVHPAVYRAVGTNGKDDYTHDSLHSVYFAVPNDMIEKYGEMTAIHATWLNAVLAPGLVTGNKKAYDLISKGQVVFEPYMDILPSYLAGFHIPPVGDIYDGNLSAEIGYNVPSNLIYDFVPPYRFDLDFVQKLNLIHLTFFSGSAEDSADLYTVSSRELQSKMFSISEPFHFWDCLSNVNGKYLRSLFSNVDKEFTDFYKRADDTFTLTSEVIGSSFWDRLFGRTETTVFDGIPVLQKVDLSSYPGVFAETFAQGYFVSLEDFFDLYSFYLDKCAENTIYLFRYQVSDYRAIEAELHYFEYDDSEERYIFSDAVDTNAYFFQETVNLDFDIIDVEFTNDIGSTVVPVVSNPQDIISPITPPGSTTSDKDTPWWFWAILVLVAVLLLCLIKPVFEVVVLILKAVWWIISSPVRLIIWIVRRVRGDYD